MIHFVNVPITLDASAGEDAPKTITGIAVPWAPVSATVMDGTKVSFARGAFDLDMKNPKLLENHDMSLRSIVRSDKFFQLNYKTICIPSRSRTYKPKHRFLRPTCLPFHHRDVKPIP